MKRSCNKKEKTERIYFLKREKIRRKNRKTL